MNVKIKAIDTLMDHRTGLLQPGQEVEVSESVAKELETLGLVKAVSGKKMPAPENKMIKPEKISKK